MLTALILISLPASFAASVSNPEANILTAIFGLGATGIAVGRANDKEEKVSRLVTIGIPAVIGLGTNIVCTAALLSGPVGILTGLAASFITNRIAVAFDKHVLGHDDEDVEEPAKTKKNTKEKQVEVQNA